MRQPEGRRESRCMGLKMWKKSGDIMGLKLLQTLEHEKCCLVDANVVIVVVVVVVVSSQRPDR